MVLICCGGDKRTQDVDIRALRSLRSDCQRRSPGSRNPGRSAERCSYCRCRNGPCHGWRDWCARLPRETRRNRRSDVTRSTNPWHRAANSREGVCRYVGPERLLSLPKVIALKGLGTGAARPVSWDVTYYGFKRNLPTKSRMSLLPSTSDQRQSKPPCSPFKAARVRSLTPSFSNILATWFLTVPSLMASALAISRLL